MDITTYATETAATIAAAAATTPARHTNRITTITVDGVDYYSLVKWTRTWDSRRTKVFTSIPQDWSLATATTSVEAHNRSYVKACRTAITSSLTETELAALGTLTFTRTAGCSCPCSPGFRAKDSSNWAVSVWIQPVTEAGVPDYWESHLKYES